MLIINKINNKKPGMSVPKSFKLFIISIIKTIENKLKTASVEFWFFSDTFFALNKSYITEYNSETGTNKPYKYFSKVNMMK